MGIELFDEDIDEVYQEFTSEPWRHLTNDDVVNSNKLPIRISYEYADMGKTAYSFSQHFTERDVKEYFSKMKHISGKTIWELVDEETVSLRRHSGGLHKKLKMVLEQLNPEIAKGEPIIFHFHLYTDKNESSRQTGVRSPRVYFMQGTYGVIYILFFDPFHEITR